MLDLCRHPRVLQCLYGYYRLRAAATRRTGNSSSSRRIRSEFYRRAWEDAAESLGGTTVDLGEGFLEVRIGDFRTRVLQNDTAMDDYVTVRLAASKPICFRLLAARGLPIAKYAEFDLMSMEQASCFLKEARRECVVKPAHGWGGVGVTTGIRSAGQLARASAAASVYDKKLLIQEQVNGDFYRLVYLDGELLDVVARRSPSVVGDGVSTVAQLVRQSNMQRLRKGSRLCQALLQIDLDMHGTLARQQLRLSSVPVAGQVVRLKTVINDNSATENVEARGLLCPSVIREGAEAADAAQARLAGVDVVTPDPGISLSDAGGAILEVNTATGHYWHYHRQGEPFPLAAVILRVLRKARQAERSDHDAKVSPVDVPRQAVNHRETAGA